MTSGRNQAASTLYSSKQSVQGIHAKELHKLNLNAELQVCDFGLARIRSSTWMTGSSQGGTPEW